MACCDEWGGASMPGPGLEPGNSPELPRRQVKEWREVREWRERSGQKEDSHRGVDIKGKGLGPQMQPFLTVQDSN